MLLSDPTGRWSIRTTKPTGEQHDSRANYTHLGRGIVDAVVYLIVYTLAIPWLRTLAFVVGWLATGAILIELL